MQTDPLEELFLTIKDRQNNPRSDSYTCKLFTKGENTILKKLGEEIVELVMAFKDRNPAEIRAETGDVFYHILVALAYYGIDLKEVYKVLEMRRKG